MVDGGWRPQRCGWAYVSKPVLRHVFRVSVQPWDVPQFYINVPKLQVGIPKHTSASVFFLILPHTPLLSPPYQYYTDYVLFTLLVTTFICTAARKPPIFYTFRHSPHPLLPTPSAPTAEQTNKRVSFIHHRNIPLHHNNSRCLSKKSPIKATI